ncbi:hypothetical protein NDU88_004268 [Pleurodeles waltl]|uniref:Uncharacterized protein n=1 Tax=Pleurodeles waltl TaxID=8319 RepID=A0AAV7W7M4_PLEWA|nr:hypothetical protein NDU88_004268 [Pleurodeles waltl]
MATPNQHTISCSSLVEIVAHSSSNPRCSSVPCVPVKQELATGMVLGRSVEAKGPAATSLDVPSIEARLVFGEAGASWQALLTTWDTMSTAIYYQADKQETQVDLLNVLAVHIVSIDKKLQGLNDLTRRAQTHSYTQQVQCQCASTGDSSPRTTELLNEILPEVRAQALRCQNGLCKRVGPTHENFQERTAADSEIRNQEPAISNPQATDPSQQEVIQNLIRASNTLPAGSTEDGTVGEALTATVAIKVSLTKWGKKRLRKSRKKVKVAQQNSIWRSLVKFTSTQGNVPAGKDG